MSASHSRTLLKMFFLIYFLIEGKLLYNVVSFSAVQQHKSGIIMYVCCPRSFPSCPTLCNLGTGARQAPLSMGFSRQEYWSGLLSPPPRDLPDPGIKPIPPASPALQAVSLPTEPPRKPIITYKHLSKIRIHLAVLGLNCSTWDLHSSV